MLVHPNFEPRVTTKFKASRETTSINKPLISKDEEPDCSILLSGTSLMRNIARRAKIIEKIKIHLQPIYVAIAPPAKEQTPEPPQEPMDQ
jgi:hypothetical protein